MSDEIKTVYHRYRYDARNATGRMLAVSRSWNRANEKKNNKKNKKKKKRIGRIAVK